MDEQQRRDVMSLFEGMTESANDAKPQTHKRRKKGAITRIRANTVVVCDGATTRKVLKAVRKGVR